MKRCMNVVMWVLTIFMALGTLVYIPSAASAIMFVFAVIAAPIKPLQSFFKSKGLSGVIKGVLLTVLFFLAISLAPTSEEREAKNEEKKSISDNVDRNIAASDLDETKLDAPQEQEKNEEEVDPDFKLKLIVLLFLDSNGVKDTDVTVLKNRVDIKVYSDYSKDIRPEEWDSIVDRNVTLCKALKDETEETGGRSVSIVQYGNDNTILLTVIDGKCKHDFYNDTDKIYLGSSYVSFEKHSVKKGDEVLFDIKVGNTTKAEIESVSSDELTEFMNKIDFSGTNGNAVLMFEDGTGLNIMQIGASQYADYGYMDVSDGEYTMTERLGAIWNDTESGWYYKTVDEMRESDNAEANSGENKSEISTTGNGSNFNTYDYESQQQTTQSWVLNTSSMKIHYPSCREVKKIAPHNYSTSSLSESDLISQGYTTCGVCH